MDNDGRDNGFAAGIITGALVGAGLALLFAPKAGTELRGDLNDSLGSLRDAVARRYRALADMAGVELENFEERVDRAAASISPAPARCSTPRSSGGRGRSEWRHSTSWSGRACTSAPLNISRRQPVGDRAWKGHAMIPRFVLTTVGAAVASLAAASAQPPAPTQPTAPQPGAMVTVEGCLTKEPGPKSSTAAFTYVLTDRRRRPPRPGRRRRRAARPLPGRRRRCARCTSCARTATPSPSTSTSTTRSVSPARRPPR